MNALEKGNARKRSCISEENNHMKRKRRNQENGVLEESKYGDGMAWFRGPLIGEGSFGSVFLANLKKPKSKYSSYPPIMAVKSAEVSVSCSIQKEREVFNDIRGCPNVIKCFGEEITIGDDGKMVYNLLLEYGSGGTLADLIKKSCGNGLPEFDVRRYTRSILCGLCHIHSCGYVHCDLKPENILLVGDSNNGFKVKIGDLGLAKRESKSVPYWRGTPMYLSPEVVINGVQEAPSDVWAIGCIVLEMLTGKPPWESNIFSRIGDMNGSPYVPNTISIEGRSFLKCCFARKVMYRLTAEMLLDHPFLEGICDDEVEELEEVLNINDISSSMVDSVSDDDDNDDDDEIKFSSFSHGLSYISEDGVEDMEKQKGFCFSVEESTNVALNDVKKYPIKFTVSAGV